MPSNAANEPLPGRVVLAMAERIGTVLGPPSGSLNPDLGRVIASGSPHYHPGDVAAILPTSGLWLFEPGKPTLRYLLSPAQAHIPMVYRHGQWIASPGWAIVEPSIVDPYPAETQSAPTSDPANHQPLLLAPSTQPTDSCLPVRVISHAALQGSIALIEPSTTRYRVRFAESSSLPQTTLIIPERQIVALLDPQSTPNT